MYAINNYELHYKCCTEYLSLNGLLGDNCYFAQLQIRGKMQEEGSVIRDSILEHSINIFST